MLAPRYMTDFICTAASCTHSCCIGWEIDVDGATVDYYRSLPEKERSKILKTIRFDAEGAHFGLGADGRCLNLDKHGLCRIIRMLGKQALCDICREHPRFYHDTDREEAGLGAACEAAAALILTSDAYADFIPIDGDDSPVPLATDFNPREERERLYALLSDRARPLTARLALLDAGYGRCVADRMVLHALEYLDEAHRRLLTNAGQALFSAEYAELCERFFAYLIYRHASPTASRADFARAVRLSRFVLELFDALVEVNGMSPVTAAVTLSEEIEYSEDNTARLLAAV